MRDRPRPPKSELRILMEEAGRYPLLSLEREAELSRTILANSDADAVKAAIEELVNSNVRLVIYCVTKTMSRDPKFPIADLVAAGLPGLFYAARKFDGSKSSFSTYAMHWIRQQIQYYKRENDPSRAAHVPAYVIHAASRQDKLGELLKDSPAAWSNGHRYAAYAKHTSQAFDPEQHSPVTRDPEVYFDDPSDADEARRLLKAVRPKERIAIEMRYCLSSPSGRRPTLAVIGKRLGVSREYASQLIESGIERMRSHARMAV